MKRLLLVGILVALLAVAAALAWNTASRDRQYRRLIEAGDGALTSGQTFLAIESFSGAIALKPASENVVGDRAGVNAAADSSCRSRSPSCR